MKKVILAPDSFKGTIGSVEICEIMEKAVRKFYPQAEVLKVPAADGGEGTVDAFLAALGGEKKKVSVQGPFGRKTEGFFGIIKNRTAVIEMACCAGLPLAGTEKNPALASAYGVGELIKSALDEGCTKIILGIGGSASNDGGCGAAAALGVKFYDSNGCFIPTGGTLCKIEHIDKTNLDPRIKNIKLLTMCDIDNPLYGKNGAAYIYAPQKGADPQMVKLLDDGLRHLAEIVKKDLSVDIAGTSGAGAAGGMGYGMRVFLNSGMQMGIETVLDTVNFDEIANGADYVFTGEGKIDAQSLSGKAVIGIARRAKKLNIPLIVLAGVIDEGIEAVYDMGVSSIFCINSRAEDFSSPELNVKKNLAFSMENILRLL